MTRLLVLWTKLVSLTAQDMVDWVDREAVRLHQLPSVKGLVLTRLARFGDMRLMAMRPVLVLADGTRALEPDDL